MKRGTVISREETEKAAPGWGSARVFQVRCGLEELAAVDLSGAQPGDPVLIVTGAAARQQCMEPVADAVIVAVLRKE